MSERVFLQLARAQNGIGVGPRKYDWPVHGSKDYWCMGCGATIGAGAEHARGISAGRVCAACVADASDMVPSEPIARVTVSAETLALLMDGAVDDIEGRVSVIAVLWDDDVEREEAHRLSRAWAAKISEKAVVVCTRIRVYGERRLEVVA